MPWRRRFTTRRVRLVPTAPALVAIADNKLQCCGFSSSTWHNRQLYWVLAAKTPRSLRRPVAVGPSPNRHHIPPAISSTYRRDCYTTLRGSWAARPARQSQRRTRSDIDAARWWRMLRRRGGCRWRPGRCRRCRGHGDRWLDGRRPRRRLRRCLWLRVRDHRRLRRGMGTVGHAGVCIIHAPSRQKGTTIMAVPRDGS